jgi:hypothetical protein
MRTCVLLLRQKSFDMILINNPSFYDGGVIGPPGPRARQAPGLRVPRRSLCECAPRSCRDGDGCDAVAMASPLLFTSSSDAAAVEAMPRHAALPSRPSLTSPVVASIRDEERSRPDRIFIAEHQF